MAEVRLLRSLEMANRRHIDQLESAVMWGGLALLVFLVYQIVTPFLVPLGWATVLAVVAYPTHERIATRWGPSRAAAISTLVGPSPDCSRAWMRWGPRSTVTWGDLTGVLVQP